jgi:hypothetical protein
VGWERHPGMEEFTLGHWDLGRISIHSTATSQGIDSVTMDAKTTISIMFFLKMKFIYSP